MGQTCQDDTRTELSRPGEPALTTRMVEKGIEQQQLRIYGSTTFSKSFHGRRNQAQNQARMVSLWTGRFHI